MKQYNIVLHRHYTITENDVIGQEEEGWNSVEEAVEARVKDWMLEEIADFGHNIDNFVTATVEEL